MAEVIKGPWPRPQFTEGEMLMLLKGIAVSLRNIERRIIKLEKKRDGPEVAEPS
jgi:hypothetical protein